MTIEEAVEKVQRACLNHPELLRPEYKEKVRKGAHPITGHCYVACEALYHLLPGTFIVYWTRVGEDTHWFLTDTHGNVIDPTIHQFPQDTWFHLHDNPTRGGFLTKEPSKRTRVIMEEVNG